MAVTETVSGLNQAYLAGIQPTVGIRGQTQTTISRDEVTQILSYFDAEGPRNTVLVTGKAGIGKSSVISQVLTKIESRDWPLLALRVDRLPSCPSPRKVWEQLGLPTSPVSSLASLARGQDCLLVIDQLDAISLASGRNPEFFDCIGALLHQAQHHPKMRVLAACRKFDVDNDYRLRQLLDDKGIAKEIPMGVFDGETVKSLVTNWGMDANGLSVKQIELLSLPVHLRLLAATLSDNSVDSLGFQTSKNLYEKFWRYKRDVVCKDIHTAQMQCVATLMINP